MLHDSILLIVVTGCMNIQEDMQHGENPTMRKFTEETTTYFFRTRTCVQMERSENAIRIKCIRPQNNRLLNKLLENQNSLGEHFEEHAKKVWERDSMNLEMQTTLLNMYPPKLICNNSEFAS